MEDQVCVVTGHQISAIVGYLIYLTGLNFIPAPDKVENKFGKILSKIAHFIAMDVTTAVKK